MSELEPSLALPTHQLPAEVVRRAQEERQLVRELAQVPVLVLEQEWEVERLLKLREVERVLGMVQPWVSHEVCAKI